MATDKHLDAETGLLVEGGSLLDHKLMQRFMNQAFIALVKKQGGSVEIPVADVDQTDGLMMTAEINQLSKVFTFKVERKQ